LLLFVALYVALHRVCIRTLDELIVMKARCRLRFERRVDAAIYESISEIKTRTQSSEYGVVATDKHSGLSGRGCVEWHVWLLSGPDAMEQDSQLARYRNDSLALGLLATALCQM